MEKNDTSKKNALEEKILSGSFDDETEIKNRITKEIEEAAALREKKECFLIETDFLKLSADEKFHRDTIYKIFNRKQKTETFVNGEQPQNLIKYSNEYVVMFDHRIVKN